MLSRHGAQGAFLRSLITTGEGARMDEVSSLRFLFEGKAVGDDGWRPLPSNDALLGKGLGAFVASLGGGLQPALSEPVEATVQAAGGVRIHTMKRTIDADAAIVTLPLALLKENRLRLEPGLSAAQSAACSPSRAARL